MTKTVLKKFSYIECDDFASYLHEMSARGWHFREWRIGLVFEKGAPADITYAVEIFPKGSEMDLYAGPDAEEYAEYCTAAGWEFLDSRQKFCIFRKAAADAPPITTPQERFSNVMRSQWKSWLSSFISSALICGLYWLQLLDFHFSDWIFNGLLLLVLAFLTFYAAAELCRAFFILILCRKYKSMLKAGQAPQYGAGRIGRCFRRLYSIFALLFSVLLILDAWRCGERAAAITAVCVFLFFLAVLLLIGWLRPSREGNQTAQIALGIAFPLLAAVIALAVTSGGNAVSNVSDVGQSLASDLPDGWKLQDSERSQSIIGSMEHYSFRMQDAEASGSDFFSYWIYRSDRPRILDRVWQTELQDIAQLQDCTAQWSADSALTNGWQYYLRYPDRVIVFWTNIKPEEKEREWLENNFKH